MVSFLELVKLIFVVSTWCIGLFIICEEGKIGYGFKLWLRYNVYSFLSHFYSTNEEASNAKDIVMKPILGCLPCMASFHSLIIFILYKILVLHNLNISFRVYHFYRPLISFDMYYHNPFSLLDLFNWIALAVICAFFNSILWSLVSFIRNIGELINDLKLEDE